MATDEIDVSAAIARIEKHGFTNPADGKVVLQFLRVIRDLSNNAADLAKGVDKELRAEMVTAKQAATMVDMIERLAGRVSLLESQLAVLQRQMTKGEN
jgi:hypothetical protein